MKYSRLDTLYLGMDGDGTHAEPGKSEHLYICNSTTGHFLPIISKLSRAFINAELTPLDTPYNLSIFLEPFTCNKFKKEDQETPYDMVVFLLKNFRRPARPLRVTIYLTIQTILNQNWDYSSLWALEHVHDKNNTEKIITFQYPQAGMKATLTDAEECFRVAESYARAHDYKIRTIDYSMRYSDMTDLLLNATLHVSYIGASYYLAGLTRTPTLGIGHKPNTKYGNIFVPPFVSPENMIRFNNRFELVNGTIDYSIDTVDPNEIVPIINILKERDPCDFFQ